MIRGTLSAFLYREPRNYHGPQVVIPGSYTLTICLEPSVSVSDFGEKCNEHREKGRPTREEMG